jgi:hypothetical protein
VTDPETFSRTRPDGVELSWDLAVVGSEEPDRSAPGGLCPFLVADHTPREARVGEPLDPAAAGVPATGVAEVVVGVPDLEAAVTTLREGFALGTPERSDDPTFGRVAHFPDAPVSLASGPTWLAERCDRFGSVPCAYLLSVNSSVDRQDESVNGPPGATAADSRERTAEERSWFGRRLRSVSGLPASVRLFTVR